MTLVLPGVEALASVVAQSDLTAEAVTAAARVLGLSLVAGGLASVVALLYRWYVRERVPGGLPALFGLSGVAILLNTDESLRKVIAPTGSGDPLDATTALVHVVTFLVAFGATRAGTDAGDRIGADVAATTGSRAVESEVSRVVQAVGRVITVELPEDVEDIVGYDPVPDETKEKLAGASFVFPRRLTVAELRDRLVTRLKADYAVGHVDVELADDGTVEYLALGSRAAGIGPTLPPETSAVAIRADPAFAASAGDLVQVWATDPAERVLTAELRGKVDDVVTLAVDAADTRRLDDATEYRLVTLPVETRPDREFASLLRAADETMAAVTVADGSSLDGQPLGALDVAVVAIRPFDGPVEPIPGRDRVLTGGDALYLVATPETIRKVEQGATASADAPGTASPGSEMPPDRRVDATTPVADVDGTGEGSVAAERRGGDRAANRRTSTETEGRTDASDRTGRADRDGADERDDDRTVDALDDADAPGIQALESDEAATDAADGESPDDGGAGNGDDDPFDLGDPDLSPLGGSGDGSDATASDGATEESDADVEPGAGDHGDESADGDGEADEGAREWTDLTTEGPAADAADVEPADEDDADAPPGEDAAAPLDGDPDEETGGAASDEDAGDGTTDAGSAGGESSAAGTGESEAEPTVDDLADLPGTDPDDLIGTDVEGVEDAEDGDGDGSAGSGSGEGDGSGRSDGRE